VLGIDGDLLNITAAKELKAHGELCFRPLTAVAAAAAATGPSAAAAAAEGAAAPGVADVQAGVGGQQQQEQQQEEEEGEVFVVRVPDAIDRDRVRCVFQGATCSARRCKSSSASMPTSAISCTNHQAHCMLYD
jgi:hypothetical protein